MDARLHTTSTLLHVCGESLISTPDWCFNFPISFVFNVETERAAGQLNELRIRWLPFRLSASVCTVPVLVQPQFHPIRRGGDSAEQRPRSSMRFHYPYRSQRKQQNNKEKIIKKCYADALVDATGWRYPTNDKRQRSSQAKTVQVTPIQRGILAFCSYREKTKNYADVLTVREAGRAAEHALLSLGTPEGS